MTASIIASVYIQSRFRMSLKREAPELHAALWGASRASAPVRTRMVVPFMIMIFLRRYREQLAPYPASRAWASWMSANNWLQLVLTAAIALAVLGK